MYKYVLTDGELVQTEYESDKTLTEMMNRTYVEPVQYDFNNYYVGNGYRYAAGRQNRENSIFHRCLGTKAFTPSNLTRWDGTRKCFVWKDNCREFLVYDASNIRMTIRGYYLSNFDTSTLPDAKNRKNNKKRYVRVNTLLEDMIADCRVWDKKAMAERTFDYTRDERLNEFRAIWMIRHLITKAFKENKRINATTLTEMFIRTNYASKFPSQNYTFGKYVRTTAEELIESLAETEKDGQSGGGRPDSDDGRP